MASKRGTVALGYEAETAVDSPIGDIVEFKEVAVLPEAGDNCGIARKVIPRGTRIRLQPGDLDSAAISLDHTTLEGHRFAVKSITPGEHLLSWNLTFGVCTRPIFPGNYCANDRLIRSLRGRNPPITDLPATPNFDDLIVPHILDEERFQPAEQVPLEANPGTFMGYPRPHGRGVGTRNYIILIGTTSVTAGYVKALEARIKSGGGVAGFPNVDGVVAVAHTEGGGIRDDAADPSGASWRPHNHGLLLRTLASFVAHANVAAALVVDYGSSSETVWGSEVRDFALSSGTPIDAVPHAFVTLSGDLSRDLDTGAALVEQWLPLANAAERSPQSLSHLSIAQQCGGSDAFSGVSGNPCAGEACMLLIRNGGKAVLAETDELMGSESYILTKVKDVETARAFLGIVERFKERLAWHGQSAESNPSGGNNYRGLYNIGLKSLGAAKKKHADVRLDGVLEYAQPAGAAERGYYMMDSPGNDLESIAGQVGTGCNLIYFITGNGSITNFPFVPTIKIVTTSARFALLESDMDFNAGRYQEGTPMPELGRELFDITMKVASGAKSVGERAGHAQVSIWRNWSQSGPTDVSKFNHGPLSGRCVAMSPLATARATVAAAVASAGSQAYPFSGYRVPRPRTLGSAAAAPPTTAGDRVGLILPTSLCSGEVARKIVNKLNGLIAAGNAPSGTANVPDADLEAGKALAAVASRFECLPHTEGCGTGYPDGGIEMYNRIMLGHLTHPSVGTALCLEHGCEKTHNDFFNGALSQLGLDPSSYGYASIQLDGGIDKVTAKVTAFFAGRARETLEAAGATGAPAPIARGPGLDARSLSVGLLLTGPASAPVAPETALLAAALARTLASHGGSLVLPSTSALLRSQLFTDEVGATSPSARQQQDDSESGAVVPSLAFGQSLLLPAISSYKCADAPEHAPEAEPEAPPAAVEAGLHVMDMPSVRDWSETVTGLAATGVHVVLALTSESSPAKPMIAPGHPLVPVLHLALTSGSAPVAEGDYSALAAATDEVLAPPAPGSSQEDTVTAWLRGTLAALARTAGGQARTKSASAPFFSVTRGHVGVST